MVSPINTIWRLCVDYERSTKIVDFRTLCYFCKNVGNNGIKTRTNALKIRNEIIADISINPTGRNGLKDRLIENDRNMNQNNILKIKVTVRNSRRRKFRLKRNKKRRLRGVVI